MSSNSDKLAEFRKQWGSADKVSVMDIFKSIEKNKNLSRAMKIDWLQYAASLAGEELENSDVAKLLDGLTAVQKLNREKREASEKATIIDPNEKTNISILKRFINKNVDLNQAIEAPKSKETFISTPTTTVTPENTQKILLMKTLVRLLVDGLEKPTVNFFSENKASILLQLSKLISGDQKLFDDFSEAFKNSAEGRGLPLDNKIYSLIKEVRKQSKLTGEGPEKTRASSPTGDQTDQ